MIFVYILYTVYCKNSIYIKSEKNNTRCALLIDRKIITNPKDMVENFNNFYLLYWEKSSNRKYVWFASFWDEKLRAGGWVDKKIPYFF